MSIRPMGPMYETLHCYPSGVGPLWKNQNYSTRAEIGKGIMQAQE
jgi:hypothetical protein